MENTQGVVYCCVCRIDPRLLLKPVPVSWTMGEGGGNPCSCLGVHHTNVPMMCLQIAGRRKRITRAVTVTRTFWWLVKLLQWAVHRTPLVRLQAESKSRPIYDTRTASVVPAYTSTVLVAVSFSSSSSTIQIPGIYNMICTTAEYDIIRSVQICYHTTLLSISSLPFLLS